MAKLTKSITGVLDGEIYPREFAKGDECPSELEDAARELGALSARKAGERDKGDDTLKGSSVAGDDSAPGDDSLKGDGGAE